MPYSVLEAIKQGNWDFDPGDQSDVEYESTGALPGTDEKVDVLSERVKQGLPLWHPKDRRSFDDSQLVPD